MRIIHTRKGDNSNKTQRKQIKNTAREITLIYGGGKVRQHYQQNLTDKININMII